MSCNVALIDDHHLMRTGLARTVNLMRGYRVSMQAGNGREFIEVLQRLEATDPTRPRIAIVDLSMPVMDGYDTIAWLCEHEPLILPLALTFDGSDGAMVRAIKAGARGFVLKTVRPVILNAALDSLQHTGYYNGTLSTEDPSEAWEAYERDERQRGIILSKISRREMEFLLLVCDAAEYTYEDIAKRMDVHIRTVDGFRNSLFEKFDIRSKTGLVLFALRWGLLNGT